MRSAGKAVCLAGETRLHVQHYGIDATPLTQAEQQINLFYVVEIFLTPCDSNDSAPPVAVHCIHRCCPISSLLLRLTENAKTRGDGRSDTEKDRDTQADVQKLRNLDESLHRYCLKASLFETLHI